MNCFIVHVFSSEKLDSYWNWKWKLAWENITVSFPKLLFPPSAAKVLWIFFFSHLPALIGFSSLCLSGGAGTAETAGGESWEAVSDCSAPAQCHHQEDPEERVSFFCLIYSTGFWILCQVMFLTWVGLLDNKGCYDDIFLLIRITINVSLPNLIIGLNPTNESKHTDDGRSIMLLEEQQAHTSWETLVVIVLKQTSTYSEETKPSVYVFICSFMLTDQIIWSSCKCRFAMLISITYRRFISTSLFSAHPYLL